MPIYAYRCTTCGNAQDVLRKISDPPLTVCPVCGADTFVKQVTAAGFQLKGSGWYVTDFRDGGNKPAVDSSAKADKASTGSSGDASAQGGDSAKASDAPSTSAAPAAAPAPASAPASSPASAPAAKPDKGST